jgi:hypothetical protein
MCDATKKYFKPSALPFEVVCAPSRPNIGGRGDNCQVRRYPIGIWNLRIIERSILLDVFTRTVLIRIPAFQDIDAIYLIGGGKQALHGQGSLKAPV